MRMRAGDLAASLLRALALAPLNTCRPSSRCSAHAAAGLMCRDLQSALMTRILIQVAFRRRRGTHGQTNERRGGCTLRADLQALKSRRFARRRTLPVGRRQVTCGVQYCRSEVEIGMVAHARESESSGERERARESKSEQERAKASERQCERE